MLHTNAMGLGRCRASVVGSRYVVWTLVICLFLALACSWCTALDSNRTIAQFAHAAWGPQDGAPSPVTALAQTSDGYLWLGGPDGLYRFDGVLFERYEPQSGGSFAVRTVSSLLALPISLYQDSHSAGGNGTLSRWSTACLVVITQRAWPAFISKTTIMRWEYSPQISVFFTTEFFVASGRSVVRLTNRIL